MVQRSESDLGWMALAAAIMHKQLLTPEGAAALIDGVPFSKIMTSEAKALDGVLVDMRAEGMTYKQIGDEMGLKMITIYKRMKRAEAGGC